jgi:hypothetical protein
MPVSQICTHTLNAMSAIGNKADGPRTRDLLRVQQSGEADQAAKAEAKRTEGRRDHEWQ